MKYLERIDDELLKRKLRSSAAVLIEGPKWCGKTSTGAQLAKSIIYIQNPDQRAMYRKIADTQPSLLLEGETPHMLDEWQTIPILWDAVRFAADQRQQMNQFILTGSATPLDEEENDQIRQMINDSGATVVVVGVGCPKQEKWIAAHKERMPGVKIWMALGATIDFEAGIVKRAPKIWQKMYLEWFYRFLQEPRRLFKRYFIDDPKFFWYFGKQLLGLYKDPFA